MEKITQKTIDSFFKIKSTLKHKSNNINSIENKINNDTNETKLVENNERKKRKIIFEDKIENDSELTKASSDDLCIKDNLKNVLTNNIKNKEKQEENEENEENKENIIKKEKNKEKIYNNFNDDYINEIKELMHIEWFEELKNEFKKNYFRNMYLKIKEERKTKIIYPPENLVFNAFLKTPLSKVKVVIVGQDPYHQKDQAMGLSFSVPHGVKIPPSLKNILKEINQKSTHGNLITWSEQGVFLLNTSLTVEESKPMSHKNYGWQKFTNEVINIINNKREKVIFMLWGNFAIKKSNMVDRNKHYVLKAGHPSPLSIKHFENCRHFDKCNQILIENNLSPIKWELPQI